MTYGRPRVYAVINMIGYDIPQNLIQGKEISKKTVQYQ